MQERLNSRTVISDGLALAQSNFWICFLIIIAGMVLSLLIAWLSLGSEWFGMIYGGGMSAGGNLDMMVQSPQATFWVSSLLGFIVTFLANAVLYLTLNAAAHEAPISFPDFIMQALRALPAILLLTLAVMLLIGVVAGIFGAIIGVAAAIGGQIMSALLGVIGVVAFLALFFYMMVPLTLLVPAILFENAGFHGLSRVWQLTNGRRWSLAAFFLLLILLFGAVFLAIFLLTWLLVSLFGIGAGDGIFGLSGPVFMVAQMLFSALLSLGMTAIIVRLYYRLIELEQG